MKDFSDMKTGLRLEMILLNEEGEWAGGPYVTQLLEPVNKYSTMIAAPIHRSSLITLPAGSSIHLSFVDEQAGIVGFQAAVINIETQNNIKVLRIDIAGELKARQRRTHYRLPICLPFAYRTYSDDQEIENAEPFRTAFTKNVSGSGFGVVLGDRLHVGDMIEVHLVLDEGRPLRGLARVVRVISTEINGSEKYLTGLSTIQLSQRDDDRLYKFIFRQQRMLLKKEAPGV